MMDNPLQSVVEQPEREGPVLAAWELFGRAAPESPMQVIPVLSVPFSVGRHQENQLCLPNPTVSGRHAEFLSDGSLLKLRDLGSTNGTFVDGKRIVTSRELQEGSTLHFGTAMFMLRRSDGSAVGETQSIEVAGEALAHTLFEKLLHDRAVIPHFQPIVRLADKRCVGYEVLARSRLAGLETPARMFRVAANRNQEAQLSCVMRREGLRIAKAMNTTSEIYLNTHPYELQHTGLLHSLAQLREEYPDVPVVLEIHEAAATSACLLSVLRKRCNHLGVRLAYDDFGAGQSRLLELVEVPPDVIKFDLQLIRGIADAARERRNTLESLIRIVRDLNVTPLAEGVETADEARVCFELGCELAQGFFFGRPAPAHKWVE